MEWKALPEMGLGAARPPANPGLTRCRFPSPQMARTAECRPAPEEHFD